MAVEKYGSKMDVVVKLVLVFFISLLSFSVGTFVGKKFSDNQHKLTKLEPGHETADREVASIHPESNEVKPKDALTDDEIKKLAEEFVGEGKDKNAAKGHDEKSPAADDIKAEKNMAQADHGSPAAVTGGHGSPEPTKAEAPAKAELPQKSAKDAATVPAGRTPSQVAERVVHGQSPYDEKSEKAQGSRIPQNLPKEVAASAAGKYTVQVAAYPTETEAQKVATDLKDKGFSAFYVSATVKDKKSGGEKTWYRVSVGLFTTQKEADAYKTDILSRAKVSSAIVQKIIN